jgi:hypothetical protein
MGGTPRALRADIAYPNLVMQDQKEPLSPRSSQPLSPRTVAAGTKVRFPIQEPSVGTLHVMFVCTFAEHTRFRDRILLVYVVAFQLKHVFSLFLALAGHGHGT